MKKRCAQSSQDISNRQLTQFESSVWLLVAQGLTNVAIATRLNKSVKSIENAIGRIYNKQQIYDDKSRSKRFTLVSNYFSGQTTESRKMRQVGTEQELANLLRNLSISFNAYDRSIRWLSNKIHRIFGQAGKDWIYDDPEKRINGFKTLFRIPVWEKLPGFEEWINDVTEELVYLLDSEMRKVLSTLFKGRRVLNITARPHWGRTEECNQNPVALLIILREKNTSYALTDNDLNYVMNDLRHGNIFLATQQMQAWSEIALRVALCRVVRMLVGAPFPELIIENKCCQREDMKPNEIKYVLPTADDFFLATGSRIRIQTESDRLIVSVE